MVWLKTEPAQNPLGASHGFYSYYKKPTEPTKLSSVDLCKTQAFCPIIFCIGSILTQIGLLARLLFGCVLMYGIHVRATSFISLSARRRPSRHYAVTVLIFDFI